MTSLTGLGSRAYGGVLLLYPRELRREFGAEMMDVFSDDLAEAMRSGGFAGALGVWWCALCEFLRIALPRLMERPAIAVPCVLFVLQEIVISAELMLAFRNRPFEAMHGILPLAEIPVAVLTPALFSALVAFVAVTAGTRGLPAPLDLGSCTCSKSTI